MDTSPPEITRLLIDHLPNQIFWKDPDGVYLGCNSAFARTVGLDSPDDVIGKTDFDFNRDPSMAASYRQWDKQVFESGEPLWELLEEYTNSDGQIGFVLTSKVPIRDSDSTIVGVLGLCVDVTERVKSERALAQSERRLRMSTEKAGVAVWEYDVVEDRMWRSQMHDALYGLEGIENWTKETFFDSTHPEDRDFTSKIVESSFLPGGPDHYTFDFRVVWPDLSIHWLSVSAEVTARDPDGNALKVCGCLVDVSERKAVEQALRQRETALREAQEIAHLANWNYDVASDTFSCSDEFYRITGIGLGKQMTKELVMARIHPDDLSDYQEAVRELHTQGKVQGIFRFIRPDGAIRHLEAQGMTDFDDGGKPSRHYGTVLDITEQQRRDEEKSMLEEQFHQAQKMEAIGRLAGGVAHDFNNLLTVINSYAELILQRVEENPELHSDTQEILKAGRQAASLTRQLLAFSRKQPMEVQLLDLNEVVRGTSKMLGRLIGEDIDLQTSLKSGIHQVRADSSQIEQILLNLAVNARDAMPNGGVLRIETDQADGTDPMSKRHGRKKSSSYVVLTVTDTGSGMGPEVLEQIFDPFFTTKEQGRGTGLGLSTVYGIVEQSGGYISVSSEPGQGTSFRVYLPATSEGPSEPSSPEKGSSPSGRETILLVEDDRAVRRLIRRSLSSLGYHVLSAGNGEEGLREFKAQPESIDLVLTDVVMPGMSGKEMTNRISALRPQTKVLYMSGYAENVIAHNGVLDEGVQFLPKPFTLANLQSKVRGILQNNE